MTVRTARRGVCRAIGAMQDGAARGQALARARSTDQSVQCCVSCLPPPMPSEVEMPRPQPPSAEWRQALARLPASLHSLNPGAMIDHMVTVCGEQDGLTATRCGKCKEHRAWQSLTRVLPAHQLASGVTRGEACACAACAAALADDLIAPTLPLAVLLLLGCASRAQPHGCGERNSPATQRGRGPPPPAPRPPSHVQH